jgi:hypothetical protein
LIIVGDKAAKWEMGWESFGAETGVAADIIVD